jgi:hypothetical protein
MEFRTATWLLVLSVAICVAPAAATEPTAALEERGPSLLEHLRTDSSSKGQPAGASSRGPLHVLDGPPSGRYDDAVIDFAVLENLVVSDWWFLSTAYPALAKKPGFGALGGASPAAAAGGADPGASGLLATNLLHLDYTAKHPAQPDRGAQQLADPPYPTAVWLLGAVLIAMVTISRRRDHV